jgi:putative hydrolase of the HAD superfamily
VNSLPPHPVDAVLLDAGGVLVHPDWTIVARVVADLGGHVDVDRLRAAEPVIWHRLDTPELVAPRTNDHSRASRFLEWVMAEAGLENAEIRAAANRTLEDWRAAGKLWVDVPEDVPDTLSSLRARGKRLAVVSNANGTMPAKLAAAGLAPFFDAIIDSAIVGVEKPDPRVFAIALGAIGVQASRALFVGDLVHIDVHGARNAGLEPVLIDKGNLYSDPPRRIRRLSELLDHVA